MDFEKIKEKIEDFVEELKTRFKKKQTNEDELDDFDEVEESDEAERPESTEMFNISSLKNKNNNDQNKSQSAKTDHNDEEEEEEYEEEYENKLDEIKYKASDFVASLKKDPVRLRKFIIYLVIVIGGVWSSWEDFFPSDKKVTLKKIRQRKTRSQKKITRKKIIKKRISKKEEIVAVSKIPTPTPTIKKSIVNEIKVNTKKTNEDLNLQEEAINSDDIKLGEDVKIKLSDRDEKKEKSDVNILENLSKKIIKKVPQKKDEYVAPPTYNKSGRGLVYNCQQSHWACVDKFSYFKCFENQKWNKLNYKKPECIVKDVYVNTSDCRKIHSYFVNMNAKAHFCKAPEAPTMKQDQEN